MRLRGLIVWAVTLFAFWGLDETLSAPKHWVFQLLPGSIFRLGPKYWIALLLTLATSLLAWLVAVCGGFLLGITASVAVVDRPESSASWNNIGRHLDHLADWVYVIPFVLTVSLTWTAVEVAGLPEPLVLVALVTVAGMALGGYNVHKSIFGAVCDAKLDNRYLVNSLFEEETWWGTRAWEAARKALHFRGQAPAAPGRVEARLGRLHLVTKIRRVLRLRDCEIESFARSLKIAFHLSIVAVMIFESVLPSVYEMIWPQSGVATPWLGGAGRLVLSASQEHQFQDIAGVIWVVLVFDTIVVTLVDFVVDRAWLRYYRGQA